MTNFNDVRQCKDVAEFHEFVRKYYEEYNITDQKKKTDYYFALLHRWLND